MDNVIGRINRIIKRITTTRSSNFTVSALEAELHAMCLLRSLADLDDYSSFTSSLFLLNSLSVSDIETGFRKEEKNRHKRGVINFDSSLLANKASTSTSPSGSASSLTSPFSTLSAAAASTPPPSSFKNSKPSFKSRKPRDWSKHTCELCTQVGHSLSKCLRLKDLSSLIKSSSNSQASNSAAVDHTATSFSFSSSPSPAHLSQLVDCHEHTSFSSSGSSIL